MVGYLSISIRPLELINIQEKHIDLQNGFIFIPHPKEKRPKIVPLIEEDIKILEKFPAGMPDLYFFRRTAGISGCKAGEQFGPRYLYKWWKKACENLQVIGVDLYGGTRHSSVVALTEYATPEQIRSGTMHTVAAISTSLQLFPFTTWTSTTKELSKRYQPNVNQSSNSSK